METLDDYRKKIDNIDKQLIGLFERRMDIVLKVAEFKRQNNLPVLQKSREEQVVGQVVSYLENPDYRHAAADFIRQVMRISRECQKQQIRSLSYENGKTEKISGIIGFQGTAGSFSEEALIGYFGKSASRKAYEEFEDVFTALQKDEIAYGVLPIENSYTGGISSIYDLLEKYGFFIIGELCIPICHHLVGTEGTTLDSIREIYSHNQGFEQSGEFLSRHKEYTLIPYRNTAISAQYVGQCRDRSKAAIASRRAAELYGLRLIQENIQNKNDNSTRFVIVGKCLVQDSSCDKVSVVFSMDHKAGTLYNLLGVFAKNQLNLVKIESRPKKDNPWTYYLYADFEGSIGSEATQSALAQIQKSAAYFRVLGCYRADHQS